MEDATMTPLRGFFKVLPSADWVKRACILSEDALCRWISPTLR